MGTPVLLVIFNRPDKLRQLIRALRTVQPTRIFVAGDGPRGRVPSDIALCEEARDLIVSQIDWECNIHTKFSDTNLGLSRNMEEAIDWFFEHVDKGIIFEDDCLPHPDFFRFADEMLGRYENDERIMTISGNNFQDGVVRGDASYYFSNYASIWGWATWKRAWNAYDRTLSKLPAFIEENTIAELFPNKKEQSQWNKNFTTPYVDIHGITRLTWATTWLFSIFTVRGLNILPNMNLVQNIGFGDDATHTRGRGKKHSIPGTSLGMIVHPVEVVADTKADDYFFRRNHLSTAWKKVYNAMNVFADAVGIKPFIIKILDNRYKKV